jgi:hypothetical protein
MYRRAQPRHEIDAPITESLFQGLVRHLGKEIYQQAENKHPGEQGGHLSERGYGEVFKEEEHRHIF